MDGLSTGRPGRARARRGIRGEEPLIPMAMSARGRDEHGHPVEPLQAPSPSDETLPVDNSR